MSVHPNLQNTRPVSMWTQVCSWGIEKPCVPGCFCASLSVIYVSELICMFTRLIASENCLGRTSKTSWKTRPVCTSLLISVSFIYWYLSNLIPHSDSGHKLSGRCICSTPVQHGSWDSFPEFREAQICTWARCRPVSEAQRGRHGPSDHAALAGNPESSGQTRVLPGRKPVHPVLLPARRTGWGQDLGGLKSFSHRFLHLSHS